MWVPTIKQPRYSTMQGDAGYAMQWNNNRINENYQKNFCKHNILPVLAGTLPYSDSIMMIFVTTIIQYKRLAQHTPIHFYTTWTRIYDYYLAHFFLIPVSTVHVLFECSPCLPSRLQLLWKPLKRAEPNMSATTYSLPVRDRKADCEIYGKRPLKSTLPRRLCQ